MKDTRTNHGTEIPSPMLAKSNFQVELTLRLTGRWDDFPNSSVAYEPIEVTAQGTNYIDTFTKVLQKLTLNLEKGEPK